jgi:TonB-dependent SusC/RagA subfamily outer membrane receptor
MITQSVRVENQATINIQLVSEAVDLNEIVVIGYGISKKSDLTGAVASIKSESLTNSKIGTVTTALQGLAAGVQVSTGSVKPGGDATVVIRGVGSLRAGSEPLYIVDGIPVQGGLQDLSSIDIESIEVLKDASSASIYGSRGSNGVVLVTTKKGSTGKTRITFNTSYGTQRMLNKQELMNAQQYYELVSIAQPDYKWTSEELRLLSRGESTDWQDAVTQNGNYQNYNIAIAGGSEKLSHYLGVDWYDQKGTIKNSSFDKLTVRYNADAIGSDWLRYGVRFNVIESKLKNINEEADSGYGTMFSAISSQPTAPIFTQDGEYFDGFLNTKANPVAIVDLLDKTTLKSRMVGSAYLEIEPIKNLKIKSDNGGELVFYKVNIYEDGRMGQHYGK